MNFSTFSKAELAVFTGQHCILVAREENSHAWLGSKRIAKCSAWQQPWPPRMLEAVGPEPLSELVRRRICVMKTNLMHYLSSVYFVNQSLRVSGTFVAHHQEVYFIYTIGTRCAEKRDV